MDFQTVRTMLDDPTKMKEVWDLACEMDAAGTSVFADKDEEYVIDFVNIVMVTALTYLVTSGKVSITNAIFMTADRDIQRYIAFCIKGAIGLAILEELR